MKTRIYFNPQCSKCRQTLQILKEKNLAPEIVEYLKTPLTESDLDHVFKLLDLEPQEVLRKGEDYHNLGLAEKNMTRKDWIALIIQHPVLLERPIVIHGGKAVIARPPERVLEIL